MKKGDRPIYTDGRPMDPRLPDGYRVREKNRRCANCMFREKSACKKWNGANIRPLYMCDAWEG